MYDELIKSLRQCAEASCAGCKNDLVEIGCRGKLQREAADAIEEMQRQRDEWESHAALAESFARGWIPVTERLPETPGEYMVAYHPCYWDKVYDEIKVGLDSFRGKTSWAKKKYKRVTHWMPLPEPPKEET